MPLAIDGKPVRKFLFARYTRVKQNGAIPVDRKQRGAVLAATDQPRYLVNVQVEAFDKDHAIRRLQELYPFVARGDWEFVDELEPQHEIGLLGASHPLLPIGVKQSRNIH